MGGINMGGIKKLCFLFLCFIGFAACNEDVKFSPTIPYSLEVNSYTLQNGDSLYGVVTIEPDSLISGTEVKKIDCRLGNIVIGTVENQLVCPFGMRIEDKPIGVHTLSVIIKYQVPEFDETYLRTDLDIITIKE